MTLPASALPVETPQAFLGVSQSATGKLWRDRLDPRGAARALAIAQRYQLPEMLARVLAGRDVEIDAVEDFLDPTIRKLMPDPHTVTQMEAAAKRIADAAVRGEKVAIFGDYDVDGATSAALLAWHLRHCGLDPLIHIPDRIFEGYGPNTEAVRMLADKGATLLITVDCGTTSLEPLAEAKRLGMSVVVIDHHQCGDELPVVDALVNPNRPDDLSGLGHLAAVGLVLVTLVAVNRELRARGFLDRRNAGAGFARHAASCRARHRRRCRALDRAQPRLCRQGTDRDAPARSCRPHRADGRVAAQRPAGSVASRLHAGTAHQCRRPHRPRRSRRAAAAGGRYFGGRADRRRARSAQHRAPRHRADGGGAGGSRGAGVARARGQGCGDRHRVGGLASRRGRACRLAAEGKILAAGVCDRAGAGRHRHRLGPLDLRRRSRQGGAAGGDRRAADERRRPRHGGGRDAAQGTAGGIPRLHGKRAGATMSRSRATPTSCSSTAR